MNKLKIKSCDHQANYITQYSFEICINILLLIKEDQSLNKDKII